MEEKSKEKTKLTKEERKAKIKQFWSDNKELLVQVGVALLGFTGAVLGFIGIGIDHRLTREDQDRERAVIYDRLNDVSWYLEKPLTNEETKELIRRENDGEDIMDILEDMGKI